MIELTNDSEIFSATRHSVELFDDFENWTKVGAVEDSPTFETFHITADQAFTGKSMSASVAWSSRSKILAVDSLESKWEKADKLPRNHVSEVVSVSFIVHLVFRLTTNILKMLFSTAGLGVFHFK